MKVVEIVPRARARLYGMLVAKEAAIRKGGRGTYEDERKLLSSFLGFVDRHSGDQVATITIHYR